MVALALPLMEFVPFSANGGGLALMAFGLAMIARDGVVAVLALVLSSGTLGLSAGSWPAISEPVDWSTDHS